MKSDKELEKGCGRKIGIIESYEGSNEGDYMYCGEAGLCPECKAQLLGRKEELKQKIQTPQEKELKEKSDVLCIVKPVENNPKKIQGVKGE